MSGHGHLEGVNTGTLDKQSVGGHIVAVLRQLVSPEGSQVVDDDVRQFAAEILDRFDAATSFEEQGGIISDFTAAAAQLIIALHIGTHGEFGKMVNGLLQSIATEHARQQGDLRSVTSSKELDDIDMSKVKFTRE